MEQREIDVLLRHLQTSNNDVRDASLQALAELVEVLPSFNFDQANALSVMQRLFVAKHDPEDYVREVADRCLQREGKLRCVVRV